MEKGGKNSCKNLSAMSLDQFVSTMAPLLDLERTLDAAQKKGSTILNLKCVDAQTGLMGKSLLEFQSTKGDVLPAHKDSSITVAFDDIPEEGLNSPLRLEKVANEVTYRRMKDTLIQLTK